MNNLSQQQKQALLGVGLYVPIWTMTTLYSCVRSVDASRDRVAFAIAIGIPLMYIINFLLLTEIKKIKKVVVMLIIATLGIVFVPGLFSKNFICPALIMIVLAIAKTEKIKKK